MSNIILVNAGQCGNQLGYSMLDGAYKELRGEIEKEKGFSDNLEIIFRPQSDARKAPLARCVCLDTEPKVVNDCVARAGRKNPWRFDPSTIAYRHGGAGNNWAVGYAMCSDEFLEAALDCIRRQLEYCDYPTTLLTTHAVGGGTGSGLGTKLTETLSDYFSECNLLNIAVTPYHFSEVVVQHYNSLLCLSKVSSSANGILLFENEVARDLCKSMRKIARPTLEDINATLASNILPVILPKLKQDGRAIATLHHDVAHLCSHPDFKFLDTKLTPQTSAASVEYTFDSWSALMKSMEKMQSLGLATEVRSQSALSSSTACVNVSTLAVLRGLGAAEAAEQCITSMRSSKSILHANWTAGLENLAVCTSPHSVNGYQRSMSLISNGQTILPYFQRLLYKSSDMFRSGAYLHQYTSEKLEIYDFVESFRSLGQITENYKSLSL